MASNEIEIVVRSTDRTGAGFDQAEKRAKGLHGTLRTIGAAATGFLAANVIGAATTRLTGFIGDSINAAKNLGESQNAVNKIFKGSSGEILAWGKNNANAIGMSQRAFNEFAVPLGAMLKNIGFGVKEITGDVETLAERSADIASVVNADVADVSGAIQSAIRGEFDSLEQYGIHLNAAIVAREALAETGKKVVSDLTDEEKARATVNLVLKQSDDMAGDFKDTSDDLANAQRRATAETEDMQAKIGQKLVPVALLWTKVKLKLVELLTEKLIPAMEKIGTFVREHATLFGVLAVVIGGALVAAFLMWAGAAATAAVATIAATWPILAIGAAIALLVAGLIYAYRHSETFRSIVKTAMHGAKAAFDLAKDAAVKLKDVAVGAFRWMAGKWLDLVGAIVHGAAKAFGWVPGLGPKLKAAAEKFDRFRDHVNRVLGGIRDEVVHVRLAFDPGTGRRRFGGITAAMAHGGIVGAAGGGPRGGLTMVGEHGRELVRLPVGSSVMSNPDTERALGGAGGGGRPLHITLQVGDKVFGEVVVDTARGIIRSRGGNVQAVLGTGTA